MKKIILSFLFLWSFVEAENIFSKLPYDIKIGEKIPSKVMDMDLKKEKNDEYLFFKLSNKFTILTSYTHKVEKLIFQYKGKYDKWHHKLPKKWRKSDLIICTDSYKGSSYSDVLKIVKNNSVTDIEANEKQEKILFKVGNDMQYTFYFNSIADIDRGYCKGGLTHITVTQIEEEY